MSDLKKQYKKPPINFGNKKKITESFADEHRKRRKKRRTLDFEENRKELSSPCSTQNDDSDELELLRRKKEVSQKKPPFVVGIVRHQIYSPPILSTVGAPKKTVAPTNSNIKKGITKATEKRLLAKAAKADKVENSQYSFAPPNHNFNPPKILSVEAIISNNEPLLLTAVEKENYSKDLTPFPKCPKNTEQDNSSDLCKISNLIDQLTIKDAMTIPMKNPDVPMEKKYTVEYFERVSKEERYRLQKLCEEWTKIQSQDGIKEDIRCQINQAVGQTTLLIKKFEQFYDLIQDCERKDGNVSVTCTDLHRFWDTMYIEVKDCYSRFAKLEKLRDRCWQEDQSSSTISTRPKEKIVTKIPVKKSSLQSIISSDKKKKMAKIQDNEQKRIELQEITINVNNDQCSITPCVTKKSKFLLSPITPNTEKNIKSGQRGALKKRKPNKAMLDAITIKIEISPSKESEVILTTSINDN